MDENLGERNFHSLTLGMDIDIDDVEVENMVFPPSQKECTSPYPKFNQF